MNHHYFNNILSAAEMNKLELNELKLFLHTPLGRSLCRILKSGVVFKSYLRNRRI